MGRETENSVVIRKAAKPRCFRNYDTECYFYCSPQHEGCII